MTHVSASDMMTHSEGDEEALTTLNMGFMADFGARPGLGGANAALVPYGLCGPKCRGPGCRGNGGGDKGDGT